MQRRGAAWCQRLRLVEGVDLAELEGSLLRVTMRDLTETTPRVLGWLHQNGVAYRHLASQRADLETVFLSLTGRKVRNA